MLGPAVTLDSNQLVRLDAADGSNVSRKTLFGLDAGVLEDVMTSIGEPAWRGKQIAEALYRQWVGDIPGVTTLPKALRQKLAEDGFEIGRPRIAQVFQSVDGTERYLVECGGPDADTVETVWMPEGDDGEAGDGTDSNASADAGDGERWGRGTT